MQNLNALLGTTNANLFRAALASNYRRPVYSLQTLSEDRSTVIYDFTQPQPYYLLRSASLDFRDDGSAASATFVIANTNGMFDRFGNGSDYTSLLEDRIIQYQKGFICAGQSLLIPAFYGRITEVSGSYVRNSEQVFNVKALDFSKHIVKRNATSSSYVNWWPNQIAYDILTRFGNFIAPWNPSTSYQAFYLNPSTNQANFGSGFCYYNGLTYKAIPQSIGSNVGIVPTNTSYWTPVAVAGSILLAGTGAFPAYPQAQFPDMGIMEMLQDLFNPLMFMARCDEAGNFITTPMIGSPYGTFSNGESSYDVLGFPDAQSAPSVESDCIIPSAALISALEPTWQDHQFVNQIRVLGAAANTINTLGPPVILQSVTNQQVAGSGNDSVVQQAYSYSDQTGNGGNAVIASNIIVNLTWNTAPTEYNPSTMYMSSLHWRGAWSATSPAVGTMLTMSGPTPWAYIGSRTYGIVTTVPSWAGPYSAGTGNNDADVVEYGGSPYACMVSGTTQVPGEGTDWQQVALSGPYYNPQIDASDFNTKGSFISATNEYAICSPEPACCGSFGFGTYSPSSIYIYLIGHSFGNSGNYGGFTCNMQIWGNPSVVNTNAVTAYSDYNVTEVAAAGSGDGYLPAFNPASTQPTGDVFDDHITYQTAHAPISMQTPVHLYRQCGAWSSTTAYNIGDQVSLSGTAYQCRVANTNETPPNATYWVSLGSNPIDLGAIAADQSVLTGDNNFKVDYERGRVVLLDASYQTFVEDDASSSHYSTVPPAYYGVKTSQYSNQNYPSFVPMYGSTSNSDVPGVGGFNPIGSISSAIDTSGLVNVTVPYPILQTYRQGEQIYTIGGLQFGQSVNLIFYFVEPGVFPGGTVTQTNQRLFSVFANGQEIISALDILDEVEAVNKAYMVQVNGVAPILDPNGSGNGVIIINITQYAPSATYNSDGTLNTGSGFSHRIPACFGNNGSDLKGIPICSGIEVQNPAFPGADALAINSGGPEVQPPVLPTYQVSYGWSLVQQTYGISYSTIDNPLLANTSIYAVYDQLASYTVGAQVSFNGNSYVCISNTTGNQPIVGGNTWWTQIPNLSLIQAIANAYVNRAAWSRYSIVVSCASLPQIQPGDITQFYNPMLNLTFWGYIYEVKRQSERTASSGEGLPDMDQYMVYILYVGNT